MEDKKFKSRNEALISLKEMFARWDGYLTGVGVEEVDEEIYTERTIKDDVLHLWAWQKISVERLAAAVERREPEFGWVPEKFLPNVDTYTEEFNEFLYWSNKNVTWEEACGGWRESFGSLLKLVPLLPDDWLFDDKKYKWLEGHKLIEVLNGTYNHHAEHWGYLGEDK